MTPAVTPDPTQQQAPDPQVQGTPQGPPAANALPTPQAAPAQPADDPNTHGWRAVLKGALGGLEEHLKGAGKGLITGGIPGAVIGAVAPDMAENAMKFRQQKQQATIKFTNAEAANQVAEAHYRDAQLHQMPAELKIKQEALDNDTAKTWISAGVYPEIVIPNTNEGAHAAADQLMKKYGAVPSLVYLHMGDELVGFDPTKLASNTAVLSQVNVLQKVTGGPAYNPASLKNAPNKTQLTQDAAHLFSPSFPGMDKAKGLISQYDGYIAKVKMWPDADPDKATTLQKLQDAKSGLNTAYKSRLEDQNKQAAIRGSAAQNAKAVEVVDPTTNVAKYVSAGEAKAKGLTSSATAFKSEGKTASLEDMQVGSQNARTAINGLKSGLDAQTITQLTAAMRATSPDLLHQYKDTILEKDLPEDQQNYVSALLNLQERALSLRQIAGQGQGSESQRDAILRLLPQVKDLGNKQLVQKKLDAFDQQIGIYMKNIPKVNKTTQVNPPAAGGNSSPAGGAITHVSSDGKWAWNGTAWIANPKGAK